MARSAEDSYLAGFGAGAGALCEWLYGFKTFPKCSTFAAAA